MEENIYEEILEEDEYVHFYAQELLRPIRIIHFIFVAFIV